jgi:hypothetical protein
MNALSVPVITSQGCSIPQIGFGTISISRLRRTRLSCLKIRIPTH